MTLTREAWGLRFSAAGCALMIIMIGCSGGGAGESQSGSTRPAGESGALSGDAAQATVELPPTPTPGGEFVIPKIKPIFGAKDVIPTLESSALMTGDAVRGKELFNTIGCSGCHSTGSDTVVGPGLSGVKQRAADRVAQIKLVPRQSVSITPDRYVEDSIVNPQNFVVPGFENATKMESFAHLSRQELADVVVYVESIP